MATTKAARVRAQLDHPMIDGDSHIVEYTPVLRDFLRERLATYKVPRRFVRVSDEELELTSSAKVRKNALRELAERRLGVEK